MLGCSNYGFILKRGWFYYKSVWAATYGILFIHPNYLEKKVSFVLLRRTPNTKILGFPIKKEMGSKGVIHGSFLLIYIIIILYFLEYQLNKSYVTTIIFLYKSINIIFNI